MILHCVFCRFRPDVATAESGAVLRDLSDFSLSLDGVLAFDFGPNRDFEKKSQGYTDGFVIRFESREALGRYADHPTHRQLGARLCALCDGGADGIMVFDLEMP